MAAGCDTLYWSSRANLGDAFDALREQRDLASAHGEATPWQVIDGFSLSLLPHGAHRYPVVLDCYEFRVHVTDSARLPTLYVELRSAFIHEVGLEAAIAASVTVANQIAGVAIGDPRVSRIDLYADYAGWELRQLDCQGFITTAKRHTDASNADEIETLRFGKTPFLLRLYRKDIERRQKQAPAPVFWNGHAGAVLRVEAQASTEFLRRLKARSVSEVLAARGDIWRYATSDFVDYRQVGPGRREQWHTRPEWRMVRETGIRHFPASGLVPMREVQGDRLRIVRLIRGCLTSLAAFDGVYDLAGVLAGLPAAVRSVDDGRSFGDAVRYKRSRLPKSLLRGHIDFARDRSPSPEGGDSESSTVGSDA